MCIRDRFYSIRHLRKSNASDDNKVVALVGTGVLFGILGKMCIRDRGTGEFTLSFGNFKVQMTVPADHVVGSTGECQNYATNLSAEQKLRWQKAQTSKEPIMMVTLEEALKASASKSKAKKTWIFKAENVRDFAWTSSRRFSWDAMPIDINGKKVMCMSF